MINLLNKHYPPVLNEICEYVKNPLFEEFCSYIKEHYNCTEKIEYSACSWEKGWNVKFKKGAGTLCTVYPRESYFTVMIVIGRKEKERTEAILPMCTPELQEIYNQTKEGNGQKWLMIDIEDNNSIYNDLLKLIKIRRG